MHNQRLEKDQMFRDILLVSDLDGTLLNSKNEVSQENKDAIRFFVNHGGMFTICTGRMARSCRSLDCNINAPMITTNGTVMNAPITEEIIWCAPLHESFKSLLMKTAFHFPGLGIEVYTEAENVYTYQYNSVIEYHRTFEKYIPVTIQGFGEIRENTFTKLILMDRPERLKEVSVFLEKEIKKDKLPFCAEFSLPEFLEVRSSYGGKGIALEKLSQIVDIPLSRTIAVGDNWNDLSMLKVAGHKVAVDNAEFAVKEMANWIVGDHDHHAIAEIVDSLKLNKYKIGE